LLFSSRPNGRSENQLTQPTLLRQVLYYIRVTLKLSCLITVAGDFCGTDIGEVEWIEQKHDILTGIITEADLFEGVVREYSNSLKTWS
jgi:hypothetical protein